MDTKEIINQAHGNIVNQLFTLKTQYIEDSQERPEDFEGLEIGDVIVWLVEALN